MDRLCTIWRAFFVVVAIASVGAPFARAQSPKQLVNGDMELSADGQTVDGWMFISPSNGVLKLESEKPFTGKQAALLDSTGSEARDEELFTNLMQMVDAKPFRGKRVRLRAAVRTDKLSESAAAQLWFRVDMPPKDGTQEVGEFDNMEDRPIRTDQWQPFEIVLNVDAAAEKLAVGMFLRGRGQAWIDDVTLEEAPADTPTTGRSLGVIQQTDTSKENTSQRPPPRFQMPARVTQAFNEADKAPQQPFFTHWLWLPLVALTLFALSAVPARLVESEAHVTEPARRVLGPLPKFAVRFSFAYWLLYSFPAPFSQLIPYVGFRFAAWYQGLVAEFVAWTARSIFKIDGELVPPNGSGDTTYNYINVFIVFVLALMVAALWSAIDRRKTDYRLVKDLLHSYLRYVLALTMLGYGLAKVAWDQNQFPTVLEMGDFQLNKTWGDSSPMNVLWAFMGASRPYTVFAGLGEVIGGLLLISRRTATLGALVALGVMINIMMLNYCYDVPVKLYSTHLVCMAVYILLPSLAALANVLIWNRPASPMDLRPPYAGPVMNWVHRAIKLAIIISGFAIPIYYHAARQINYFADEVSLPAFFDEYEIAEVSLNDVTTPGDQQKWRKVKFERRPYSLSGEQKPTSWFTMTAGKEETIRTEFSLSTPDSKPNPANKSNQPAVFELTFSQHGTSTLPESAATMEQLDAGAWKLAGTSSSGRIALILKPLSKQPKLTSRGFRWINEVPFNR